MTAQEKFQQKETLKILTLVMYQVKPPVGRIFLSELLMLLFKLLENISAHPYKLLLKFTYYYYSRVHGKSLLL